MLHDLTHPIEDGMPVYPDDPEVHIALAQTVETDGADVTSIRMGSHTGTHIDAPSHSIAGGRTMADVSLDELVGDAIVLRVRGLEERQVFGWRELSRDGDLPERLPPIVVIDTGWAQWFHDERRERHPALSTDAARELVNRGMRVLAVDTLNPDLTDAAVPEFPVHDIVLGADRLIVENLCGLDDLPRHVRIGFFPLRLTGDGAPVRAVAFG